MRRHSDSNDGRRTGRGRRARDRLLKGEAPQAATTSSELSNLLYFVGDDLRESAMAVGGIESFLVKVEALLADPKMTAEAIAGLGRYADIAQRVDDLGDVLDSLCRSLFRLQEAIATERDQGTGERGEQDAVEDSVQTPSASAIA